MKLDILAFAAHPDDAEMSCGGTIARHIKLGKKVGIIDLTRGELGTRGTSEIREQEARKSSEILGIHIRENLGMRDGFFKNDEAHQLEVIRMIRKYQPEILLANAIRDRHPDHGRSAKLIEDASFLSGLRMIKTIGDNGDQNPWRARVIYHYIQDQWIVPDI
ncbi:MAG: bacillithiol biosynthesis deacetylase BshB1, partial [Chitinophagales bacterium]|nr:bacillithiol biosynthesis deacetylase BshB1 [Chitinophagales bacterium]